ncbi:MAG TPA: citrate synthase, partial [Chthoniobacterales bacterium]|nr:citrate synthase [Chthoniobacterales bacterium]
MKVYLSAPEAAAFLGVAQQTLYAYVSRGLVRSQPGFDSRSRVYNRIDLEELRARKRIRNRPQAEVAEALHWGAPLLDSALTLITKEALYYRGLNALELAVSRSFWEVACWFWTGDWGARFAQTGAAGRPKIGAVDDPFKRQQAWLIERANSDPRGYQLAMPYAGEIGASIVRRFLALLTGSANPSIDDAASELATRWCRNPQQAAPVLNAILVLALDHEINVSSFTSRVVASAGSNLYEIVNAAMCAFSGSRHGRASEKAEQLFSDLENTRSASDL